MSQTQHTATETTQDASKLTPASTKPLAIIAFRVPEDVKWALRRMAAARKTTMARLAASVLAEYAAREGEAA